MFDVRFNTKVRVTDTEEGRILKEDDGDASMYCRG